MKGLKALAAALAVTAIWQLLCLRRPRRPRRRSAPFTPLRRLRDRPQLQTGARLPEAQQKGRLLQKPQKGRLLHRLRQVPERQKPLRPRPAGQTGDPLREQDHLDAGPGKHTVTWYVKGKRSAPRVPGDGVEAAGQRSAGRRLRHGDRGHRRLRLARRRGRCTSRSSGSRPRGGPRHATDLLGEVERAAAAAGGWERGRPDRASASGRGPSPACGSRSPRRGASASPPGCRRAGSARSTRSPRGSARAGRRASAWRCSTASAARSSRRSTRRTASGSGSRSSAGPEELAERVAALAEPPHGRRFGGGTISARVGRRRRPDSGRCRSSPPGRRAAHLRSRGGGGGGRRPARPDLPETSRRGAVA